MRRDSSPSTRDARMSRLGRRQLLWLVLTGLFGVFFLSSRWGHARPLGTPTPLGSVLSRPSSPPAPSASAPVAAPASSVAPLPSSSATGDDKGPPGLQSAVVGPEGGVPLHKDGPYRSPFANPSFGKPVDIHVGLMLQDVSNYDIQKGTFSAELYLSLTSDRPMPNIDIDFTNGKIDDNEVQANLPTFRLFHIQATFTSTPDLRLYPFDTQELSIEMEDNENGTDQVHFIPDQAHTHLDVGFSVAGWDVVNLGARTLEHNFPDRFAHDDLYYDRYRFTVGIHRYATSAIFTVYVPALVIVLISLSGLWLPLDQIEVRSNTNTPMLAAAVFFHYTLSQSLPATAYLTRADKLMLAVYASLGLHMLIMWLWFALDERHVEQVFKLGMKIGAPLTVLIMLVGIFA